MAVENSLTKITLQWQEVLLHQHDQEHGQPLALLRGLIQASTPSSKVEVSNQQVEIVELREAKLWYLCYEELNYQLCATVQWASSWQQQQVVQNECTINIVSCKCSAGNTIWWCGSVWLGSSVLAMTKCLLHGKCCYWWSHVTAASLSILSTRKRSIKACWKDLYARCRCMHVEVATCQKFAKVWTIYPLIHPFYPSIYPFCHYSTSSLVNSPIFCTCTFEFTVGTINGFLVLP